MRFYSPVTQHNFNSLQDAISRYAADIAAQRNLAYTFPLTPPAPLPPPEPSIVSYQTAVPFVLPTVTMPYLQLPENLHQSYLPLLHSPQRMMLDQLCNDYHSGSVGEIQQGYIH